MRKNTYIVIAVTNLVVLLGGCSLFMRSSMCPGKCSKASFVEPDNPYYYYLKGQYLSYENDLTGYADSLEEAVSRDPEAFALRLEYAEVLSRLGRFQEALEHIKKALELRPEDENALVLAADIYAATGHTDTAVEILQKILKRRPKDKEALLTLLNLLMERGNIDKAETVVEQFIKQFPQHFLGYYFLSRIHFIRREYTEAVKTLKKCISLNPSFVGAYEDMGRIYEIINRLPDAAVAYEKALSINPNRIDLHTRVAKIYYVLGNYSRALSHLLVVEKLGEPSPELKLTIGMVYYMMGNCDKALSYLNSYLDHYPSGPMALLYSAVCLSRKGQFDKAEKFLLSISSRADENIFFTARMQLAGLYADKKDFKKAESILVQLKQKYSRRPEVYEMLARVYIQMKRYVEAKDIAQQGISINPAYPSLYFVLGVAEDKLGNFEKSLELMRKVLKFDPNNYMALNYIGYSYAEKGIRLDEAERLIRKALSLAPDDAFIIDSMGWVLYQQGRYTDAYKYLKKAVERVPSDPTLREHLADVLLKLGRKEEAIQHYKKALSLMSPDEEEAKKRVEEKLKSLENNIEK